MKRKNYESMQEYRARRAEDKAKTDTKLQGKFIWLSSRFAPTSEENPVLQHKKMQGTYIKREHGELK
jgi:hypothetical protein